MVSSVYHSIPSFCVNYSPCPGFIGSRGMRLGLESPIHKCSSRHFCRVQQGHVSLFWQLHPQCLVSLRITIEGHGKEMTTGNCWAEKDSHERFILRFLCFGKLILISHDKKTKVRADEMAQWLRTLALPEVLNSTPSPNMDAQNYFWSAMGCNALVWCADICAHKI